MTVRRFEVGRGAARTPVPGGPVAEVVVGGGDGWPMGVVRVRVAPGVSMPAHAHGASATLLIPTAGTVRVADPGDPADAVEVGPGAVATIPVGQAVTLESTGEVEADLMVVLTPPDFADRVAGWPAAGS